ncbi:MAG: hypothetical protein ABI954_11140 [Pyrinomonadaceae bacterium]
MSVIFNDLTATVGVFESVNVSFRIYSDGGEECSERYLNKIYILEPESSGNRGQWCAADKWINLLAWSPQGTFKRINHSLYFYSDDPRKTNSSQADFVLNYAPATAYDYLANRDGIVYNGAGKIVNPRNPCLSGSTIEWRQRFESNDYES